MCVGPAGHGALIENLNELDADMVFIKVKKKKKNILSFVLYLLYDDKCLPRRYMLIVNSSR